MLHSLAGSTVVCRHWCGSQLPGTIAHSQSLVPLHACGAQSVFGCFVCVALCWHAGWLDIKDIIKAFLTCADAKQLKRQHSTTNSCYTEHSSSTFTCLRCNSSRPGAVGCAVGSQLHSHADIVSVHHGEGSRAAMHDGTLCGIMVCTQAAILVPCNMAISCCASGLPPASVVTVTGLVLC